MFNKIKPVAYWLILAAAIVIALVLSWMFLRPRPGIDYRLRPAITNFYQPINHRQLFIPSLLTKKNQNQLLGLKDLKTVKLWMTFDYVNRAFNLPADYLKTSLAIKDPHYPVLTIKRYARLEKTGATSTLDLVQTAIGAYLQGHPHE